MRWFWCEAHLKASYKHDSGKVYCPDGNEWGSTCHSFGPFKTKEDAEHREASMIVIRCPQCDEERLKEKDGQYICLTCGHEFAIMAIDDQEPEIFVMGKNHKSC